MYSRDEAKQLMTDFWNGFSNYTNYQSVKRHQPIEWMLYKTGIKGLELKFDLDCKWIRSVIEVNARDNNRKLNIYNELLKYRAILETNLPQPLIWTDNHRLEIGKMVMRAYCECTNWNFHNRTVWNDMYQFMFSTMLPLQNNFNDILPVLEEKFKCMKF